VTVTVAMLTYRRPDPLAAALVELLPQLEEVPGARLLVVDNDVTPTAREVVEGLQDHRVGYIHEPRPGIAAARNRALAAAGPEDLLVFLDDDERPGRHWLRHLVGAWRAHRAAAVVGPVVSTFAEEPDPWIVAGGFFVRLRHRTGTEVGTAATNNLLLDLSQVRPLGLAFDERFGLSGGSDTVFTRRLVAAGGRVVWCDEAPVYDPVPAERATRAWVHRRALRLGNSDARARVLLAGSGPRRAVTRLRETARGGARVVLGGLRAAYGRMTGSLTHRARGTRTLLRGAGMLRGAWGSVLHEYAR
jgi:glycosyltransferase involved in cell wall biosynthesis